MKKTFKLFTFLFACFLVIPNFAHADAVEGDSIITIGENLTQPQKDTILSEMGYQKGDTIVNVTNAEEHKYLGSYIPKAQIGTKAISSAKIQIAKKGSGISIITKNINWVTQEMYANALVTAGVKDVQVYITAPMSVSGTGALTGMLKAYDEISDKPLTEDQKKVANQEVATTAKIAQEIGQSKGEEQGKTEAGKLISGIKEEVAKEKEQNAGEINQEEMKQIVQNTANNLNINVGDVQINNLTNLFMNIDKLPSTDWNQMTTQLDKAQDNIAGLKDKFSDVASQTKDSVSNFFGSEKGKQAVEDAKGFFGTLWEGIKNAASAFGTFISNLFS